MTLDTSWTHWINAFAGRWEILDWIMIALTQGGVVLLVALIALRWWSKNDRSAARYVAISCGLGTALGLLFNQAILLFVHRPRPYDLGLTHLLIGRSQDPSFPSDHATVVFAIAFSLLAKRDRYTGLFFLAALLVSVSRVYVGTHYVTDVLGGATTAAVATLLVALFYRERSRLNQRLVRIL
jgi:undecaprenyl-diphosphatase